MEGQKCGSPNEPWSLQVRLRDVWNKGLKGPILLKNFLWIHISPHLYALSATVRDVYNMGLKGPIFGQLGPQISQNYFLWSLSQNVFTGFTSVLLYMFIASTFTDVWNKGIRGTIWGPFWSQNKSTLRSLEIFAIIFHWLHISLGLHVDLGYFKKFIEYQSQRPNFWPILGPK